MEFLEVAGKAIQRPSLDVEDLSIEPALFKGEFDIKSARISDGDQAGVIGEGSLSTVLVSSVGLANARLAPLELSSVRLDNVDLSNAVLSEITARRVEFLRSRGIGLQIRFVQAVDVYAEDCRFDFGAVSFEQIKNAVIFRRCSFKETLFAGDLSNVVFDDCDLNMTEFDATRASGCDLTESRLIGVRGLLTLRGARIYAEQARSVASEIASEAGLTVID